MKRLIRETLRDRRRRGEVITLILVFVLVWAVVLALPYLLKPRVTYSRNTCRANLKQIDGAKQQWALDNRKTKADAPTWNDLIGEGKYMRAQPSCPIGGSYSIAPVGDSPTCSAHAKNPERSLKP